jgi:hypothetical protein
MQRLGTFGNDLSQHGDGPRDADIPLNMAGVAVDQYGINRILKNLDRTASYWHESGYVRLVSEYTRR